MQKQEVIKTGQGLGYGSAIAHHGEILQGVFEEGEGELRRGLVTLPCKMFTSHSRFALVPGSRSVTVSPAWRMKARRAAELTLQCCGMADSGGHLTISSNIPVGWGFGSSTSDVTSAIRAVADAVDGTLTPKVIAEIAVKAEIASDSIMYDGSAILFAHRDGVIIENFGAPLPSLEVIGINTDTSGNGVDTLATNPPRYTWSEIGIFRTLRGLMRRAVQLQDARLLSQVASTSARVNQKYLSKPLFDKLDRLTEDIGALGLQVAHSGTILGMLFDPHDADISERLDYALCQLAQIGFQQTWRIGNGNNNRKLETP